MYKEMLWSVVDDGAKTTGAPLPPRPRIRKLSPSSTLPSPQPSVHASVSVTINSKGAAAVKSARRSRDSVPERGADSRQTPDRRLFYTFYTRVGSVARTSKCIEAICDFIGFLPVNAVDIGYEANSSPILYL